jgi:hypothetical protein
MAGIQARYGISALDLGHKEYAQDDELMVRGDDGRMYYKRTDGVIVAYADKDLSEDEVISNTMGVLMGIDGLVLPEKEYIVYRTIDTTGKLDLVSSSDVAIERRFTMSPNIPGFFFRIRGNKEVSSAAAILKSIYASRVANGTDPEVTVKIAVSNNGASEQTYTVNTILDKVNFIKFTGFTNPANYIVKIVSVSFPLFKAAYTAARPVDKKTLQDINNGNETFEINTIDVIGYANDIRFLADENTDGVLIKTVTNSKTASTTYTAQNAAVASVGGIGKYEIVIQKENPNTECIWGKIIEQKE